MLVLLEKFTTTFNPEEYAIWECMIKQRAEKLKIFRTLYFCFIIINLKSLLFFYLKKENSKLLNLIQLQ